MSRALDMLRALALSAPGHEINERNEETPRPVRVNSSNSFISSSETLGGAPTDKRVAHAENTFPPGVPPHWADGYATISRMPAPRGITPKRWHRVVDAAGEFLRLWGAQACRCGWSDLDVFGCHPDRPDVRFDCMGVVLLLDRCEVVSVDVDGADLVSPPDVKQRYYRRPLSAETVALWELARAP